MSKSPFKPTQAASKMDMGKVGRFAEMMKQGKWNWNTIDKIIVDKNGAIMSGHHRIMAAMKAGVEVPESAIFRYNGTTVRQIFEWADVLP